MDSREKDPGKLVEHKAWCLPPLLNSPCSCSTVFPVGTPCKKAHMSGYHRAWPRWVVSVNSSLIGREGSSFTFWKFPHDPTLCIKEYLNHLHLNVPLALTSAYPSFPDLLLCLGSSGPTHPTIHHASKKLRHHPAFFLQLHLCQVNPPSSLHLPCYNLGLANYLISLGLLQPPTWYPAFLSIL